MPGPTAVLAVLHLDVGPPGAAVSIDGQERGITPLRLSLHAGSYVIRVQKEGYDPLVRDVELRPGDEMIVAASLRDVALPIAEIKGLPGALRVGEILAIHAQAEDNQGVVRLRLLIDGVLVSKVNGNRLDYTWDTQTATAGQHTVAAEAEDAAGNIGRVMHTVSILAVPTAEPSVTPRPSATLAASTPTRMVPEARAYETIVTLSAYPYESYLKEKPDPRYGFRVLWLDRAAYEAAQPQPQPRKFTAVVLENRYLQLTFLPELGGRLYKCVLKSTGQNLFYENQVLKPSYWGPLSREENWWLAAGGLEWALPVHEHGYEWGLPWTYRLESRTDGVTIVLRDYGYDDRLYSEIRVTLPSQGAHFVVEPRVVNPTSQALACQFWLNAALTLGSTSASAATEFIYPTERMIVHSAGDPALPGERQAISWPVYEGRDLSHYGNWRNWLGVFAGVPPTYIGAYNHTTELGIARVFSPQVVAGLKLFGFGAEFAARAEYSDDGSDYFEMWSGPCRTFWLEDDVLIEPGQSWQWREVWLPFRQIGGLDMANEEVAVWAGVQGRQIELGVTASRTQRVEMTLLWNGQRFYQEQRNLSPDAPLLLRVPFPDNTSLPGDLTVQIGPGSTGLLEYIKRITP